MASHDIKQKSVLLATRPLSPPWDEASKNFAHDLARFSRRVDMSIMVNDSNSDMPSSVIQHPVYRDNFLSFSQKLRSLSFQWTHRSAFDVVHYLFTPTRLNTALAQFINSCARPRPKTVQTIATLREDLWSDDMLQKNCFADALVAYTKHSQKKLASLGVANTHVITPGIDLSRYCPEKKDVEMLSTLGIPAENLVITFPGEYSRLGGVDHIIDAVEEVFRPGGLDREKTTFLLALRVKKEHGDEQKKKEVQQRLSRLGLERCVLLTDTIRDMHKLYNLSDIILFPVLDMHGKFDVPLVIPEAYACEKPVVVSDLPTFREFTNPDICAIVQTAQKEAIVEAILDLAKNPQRRTVLGKNARSFCLEHFDIAQTTEKYEDLYYSLS
ncbi:MAG: glycosyltransferase family 4 protein [Candidatus Moranbacteria bacterium]|nr:glycosyltransferase family 4 protein [Candidatus Moranbacteria bacterium]